MMSDFEVRANNIATAISGTKQRVEHFGYDDDSPDEAESRIIGMYITWLTATEEARHQQANGNASFRRDVIDQLPITDDSSWGSYISPQPTSTLKQRAEALWGIRIAFSHGDGDINLITNQTNKNYVLDSVNHFPNIRIENNKLILNSSIIGKAIRTMVQIRDVLPLS